MCRCCIPLLGFPGCFFSRLAIKTCIFASSRLPMLRSFAVYTIPVVVFALAWNIPRFGEPTSLLHFSFHGSSFKSIFREPVDLFLLLSFRWADHLLCGGEHISGMEWNWQQCHRHWRRSKQWGQDESKHLNLSDFKSVFLRSCKLSPARRLRWKHNSARPASAQMCLTSLDSSSSPISSSWFLFLLVSWHSSTSNSFKQ